MSYVFEGRLQQLGECIYELSNQAQYLQELFNICLEDYKHTKKQQDLNSININCQNDIGNKRRDSKRGKRKRDDIYMEMNDIHRGDYLDPRSGYMGIKRQHSEHQNIYELQSFLHTQPINEKEEKIYTSKSDSEDSSNNPNIDCRKINLRTVTITPKRREPVFVKFTIDEKERIIFDWLDLGLTVCERKWGINHWILGNFNKEQQLFKTTREKAIFMDIQRDRINNRLEMQNKDLVYKNAELAVKQYSTEQPFGLVDLCEFAYDRGIAVIAARFHLNLFEFEFLLKDLCSPQWVRMEENKWRCIPPAELTDLEIVKLSKQEGVDYTAKKTGKSTDAIKKIRKMFSVEDIRNLGQEEDASLQRNTEDNLNSLKKYRNYQVTPYDDELITF